MTGIEYLNLKNDQHSCGHCALRHRTVALRKYNPYWKAGEGDWLCDDCWQDVLENFAAPRQEA